jgi:hypothetical protein
MLRGLHVECVAVREICSIVHDLASAPRLDTGRGLAMQSSGRIDSADVEHSGPPAASDVTNGCVSSRTGKHVAATTPLWCHPSTQSEATTDKPGRIQQEAFAPSS